jgi:hypothetical protein
LIIVLVRCTGLYRCLFREAEVSEKGDEEIHYLEAAFHEWQRNPLSLPEIDRVFLEPLEAGAYAINRERALKK